MSVFQGPMTKDKEKEKELRSKIKKLMTFFLWAGLKCTPQDDVKFYINKIDFLLGF